MIRQLKYLNLWITKRIFLFNTVFLQDMNVQCIKCKGSGMCGRVYCPFLLRSRSVFKVKHNLDKSEFASTAPAPFVGRIGYPHVNVGILAPPEPKDDAWLYDAPKHWSSHGFTIPQIVDFRSSLVNSRFNMNVHKQSKMLEISQEVGMASRPVDVEMSLKDRPRFQMHTSAQLAPMGPRADLEKADITSNPKIHRKVDRVVSDTDLKAVDALNYLYENNFDENFLTRVFTVGNLGVKKDRRLVPTRWSITAVDDTLGKKLHKQVLDFKPVNDHQAYFGSYLGNYYLVLMLPDVWSYELYETYMPKASWNTGTGIDYTTDYETYKGRKDYAANCAGGYYSVRLAVLEKMKQMKRQASCLVIRVITGEYSMPLGVWVTREAARNCLAEKPLRFGSLELMQRYAQALCHKKFGFDLDSVTNGSKVVKYAKTQMKLSRF